MLLITTCSGVFREHAYNASVFQSFQGQKPQKPSKESFPWLLFLNLHHQLIDPGVWPHWSYSVSSRRTWANILTMWKPCRDVFSYCFCQLSDLCLTQQSWLNLSSSPCRNHRHRLQQPHAHGRERERGWDTIWPESTNISLQSRSLQTEYD